jgi:hypothetical protein
MQLWTVRTAGRLTTSTSAPKHMSGSQLRLLLYLLTLNATHVMSDAVPAHTFHLLLLYTLALLQHSTAQSQPAPVRHMHCSTALLQHTLVNPHIHSLAAQLRLSN